MSINREWRYEEVAAVDEEAVVVVDVAADEDLPVVDVVDIVAAFVDEGEVVFGDVVEAGIIRIID